MKTISSPKLREKEAIVFITALIRICMNSQHKDTFSCAMSILRVRRIFSVKGMKKISTYIKRISETVPDSDNKQVLSVLVDEIEAMREDSFGIIDDGESSQHSVKMSQEENKSQDDASSHQR